MCIPCDVAVRMVMPPMREPYSMYLLNLGGIRTQCIGTAINLSLKPMSPIGYCLVIILFSIGLSTHSEGHPTKAKGGVRDSNHVNEEVSKEIV